MKKNAIIIITVIIALAIVLSIFVFINNKPKTTIIEDNFPNKMKITSVFGNNGKIPSKYTADGDDINPPLEISEIPENAESLVLIIDDPDAPVGTWDHWIVFNIPSTTTIQEDSIPGIQGKNSWGRTNYGGPSPPSGTHRYFFKLYALDTQLNLPEGATKNQVLGAMQNHILDQAQLIGLYSRG